MTLESRSDLGRHLAIATTAVAALATVLGITPVAHAQERSREQRELAPRIYGFAQLGVLGDVRVQSGDDEASDSLEPSGGGGVGLEIPLAYVFAIGAEASAWAWNSDGADDWDVGPSVLVDLSVVPRVRLPWLTAGEAHGEVGLALPIGPTVSFMNAQAQDDLSRWGVEVDTGWGMHLGLLANAQFFPVDRFGFTFDLGYLHHFAWHEVDGGILGRRQMQVDMGQLIARAGIIVTL